MHTEEVYVFVQIAASSHCGECPRASILGLVDPLRIVVKPVSSGTRLPESESQLSHVLAL